MYNNSIVNYYSVTITGDSNTEHVIDAARGNATSHDTSELRDVPWNDVYQDFPRRRRPNHNTLHCTESPPIAPIEHHHSDKGYTLRVPEW